MAINILFKITLWTWRPCLLSQDHQTAAVSMSSPWIAVLMILMFSNFLASIVSVLYIQRLVFTGAELDIKHTFNSMITRVRKRSTMFVEFSSYRFLVSAYSQVSDCWRKSVDSGNDSFTLFWKQLEHNNSFSYYCLLFVNFWTTKT